jgi:hypothetical protein
MAATPPTPPTAHPIHIIYNKSNTFGLRQDAELLKKALAPMPVKEVDPLEPSTFCGIAIHLEVPVYSVMALATVNIFVINPEWWEDSWNAYLSKAELLIFKCQADRERFLVDRPSAASVSSVVLPWTSPVPLSAFGTQKAPDALGAPSPCIWLLGGSKHKREAAEHILPLWKEDWPHLDVYTTSPLAFPAEAEATPANVTIHVKDLTSEECRKIQAASPCHLIFSASESLSLCSLEGQAAGAFLIGNSLPTYTERFADSLSVYLTPSTLVPNNAGQKDTFTSLTQSDLQAAMDKFSVSNTQDVKRLQQTAFIRRYAEFRDCVKGIVERYPNTVRPVRYLSDEELPSISVVTLLYNRRKFVDLAIHNLLATDYPKHKIEWVVVEDSDITEEQAADKVLKFGRESAPLSVSYIPVPSTFKIKNSIGMKRNTGIMRSQNEIIIFMDDDDHYPPSSFRRRVSTLLTHSWKPAAVVCSTIACYDLIHGISYVNTPPWNLPLKQRVSEATLCFHKIWWAAKEFPEINMGEGEGFLEGRETDVVELQPQQIIVAMSHSANSSSRRIGSSAGDKPYCFWGFPKEFLKWLHGIVGVEIELD